MENLILDYMNFHIKKKIFISLMLHMQKKFGTKYKNLSKNLDNIIHIRNVVAHGIDVGYGKNIRIKTRGDTIYKIDDKFHDKFHEKTGKILDALENILRKADFSI